MSRDSIGERGGRNVYGFVKGRCPNSVDPLGLYPFGPSSHERCSLIVSNMLPAYQTPGCDVTVDLNVERQGRHLTRNVGCASLGCVQVTHSDGTLWDRCEVRVFTTVMTQTRIRCSWTITVQCHCPDLKNDFPGESVFWQPSADDPTRSDDTVTVDVPHGTKPLDALPQCGTTVIID